jgi:hypothetical protein
MSALYLCSRFHRLVVHLHGQHASHRDRVAQCGFNATLTGQLYTWRHALLAAQPEAVTHTAGRFARVEVKATRTVEHVCQKAAIEASSAVPRLLANPTAQLSGRIEIVLTDGTAVRMDAQVDEVASRRVLAVLRG